MIERTLKPLLIGQDPLDHERLWEEMFWAIRGYGRKGMAFCALSAIDIGLWDLKGKIFNAPLYKLIGPYTDSVPIYGSGGWTHFTTDESSSAAGRVRRAGDPARQAESRQGLGKSEDEDVRRLSRA